MAKTDRYEKPVVVPLGELAGGQGICDAGATALTSTPECKAGNQVATVACGTGGGAQNCTNGGAAGLGGCTQGDGN